MRRAETPNWEKDPIKPKLTGADCSGTVGQITSYKVWSLSQRCMKHSLSVIASKGDAKKIIGVPNILSMPFSGVLLFRIIC